MNTYIHTHATPSNAPGVVRMSWEAATSRRPELSPVTSTQRMPKREKRACQSRSRCWHRACRDGREGGWVGESGEGYYPEAQSSLSRLPLKEPHTQSSTASGSPQGPPTPGSAARWPARRGRSCRRPWGLWDSKGGSQEDEEDEGEDDEEEAAAEEEGQEQPCNCIRSNAPAMTTLWSVLKQRGKQADCTWLSVRKPHSARVSPPNSRSRSIV